MTKENNDKFPNDLIICGVNFNKPGVWLIAAMSVAAASLSPEPTYNLAEKVLKPDIEGRIYEKPDRPAWFDTPDELDD